MSPRMIMHGLVELLHSPMTRSENALIAVALMAGVPMLINNVESINNNTRSILLRPFKDMLLPLQEAIWAGLVVTLLLPNSRNHHSLLIHNLPHRPRLLLLTNQLQLPTIHKLNPNSAGLHPLQRRAIMGTLIGRILNPRTRQTLHVSRGRITTSTAGEHRHLYLTPLDPLPLLANIPPLTQVSVVFPIMPILLVLKAPILLPLFHHCNCLLALMTASPHHLVLSP